MGRGLGGARGSSPHGSRSELAKNREQDKRPGRDPWSSPSCMGLWTERWCRRAVKGEILRTTIVLPEACGVRARSRALVQSGTPRPR